MARDLKLEVLLSAIDKVTAPLRNITQGSSAMARQLKDSRDQLKQLQAQQKDVSSFRALKVASQQAEAAMAASQAKVRDLAREIAAAGVPTKKLAAEFKRTQREAQALKQRHTEQQSALQALRGRLGDAGISTRNLSQHERELRKRVVDTNSAIGQQEERLRRATVQQQRMAKAKQAYEKTQHLAGNMAMGGAAAMANAYALSRPLAAAVGAFAPAEDAATQLKVSMMNAGGQVSEDFTMINELAKSLGDRLPGTTAQFTEMMTMLRRQGLSAQSILGGTGEAAAYLGVQLKLPAEQAAELAAKMQDATRTTEGDMMGLMDTIQRTFYLGVDPTNMLNAFGSVSPALTLLGKKGLDAANELGPLIAMLDQANLTGEAAGNALRNVLQSSLKVDKVAKANKELEKLGINLDFTNGKGEFGGLENLFSQLNKLKGLTQVQRQSVLSTIFGDDGQNTQALNTIMDKGLAGYSEVAGKMQAQADLRMRVNEQLQTLTNVIDAASGSWTNAMAEFGAAVAPELKDVIKALGSLANHVGAWARANPELAGTLIKVTAGIAALAAVGGTLAIGLAGLLGPFAMVKLGLATFGIAASGVMLPLLAVVAGLAALAGVAFLVYSNWEPIKAWFSQSWSAMLSDTLGFLGKMAALIINWSPLGLFYRAFAGVMSWFGVELPAKFTEFGANILQGLANGITSALGSVKSAITGAGEQTIGWFKEKLGIHSPSRVFAELGGFTMAGLEQGLVAGQGGPLGAIVGMGKQLAAAGAVALGMGSAGSALAIDSRPPLAASAAPAAMASPVSVTINVQAAPGMNEAELAKLVAREVQRITSQQAARGRAALYDRE